MSVTSVTFYPGAGVAFTAVATIGPIEWMDPLPKQSAPVMFRQQFMQAINSFSALSLDTPHPTLTAYLLVREGEFSAIGGGVQKFNRYYATTPPQRVEFSSYAATFPGLIFKRPPIAATSVAKITYDYILLNPAAVPTLLNETRVTDTSAGVVQPLLSDIVLNINTIPNDAQYVTSYYTPDLAGSSFSITAEGQSLERWEGNFHIIKTIKIKAK
jgi:hypothetical protein